MYIKTRNKDAKKTFVQPRFVLHRCPTSLCWLASTKSADRLKVSLQPVHSLWSSWPSLAEVCVDVFWSKYGKKYFDQNMAKKNLIKIWQTNICSGTPFINVTFTELLWGYYDSMPCVNLNRPSDCPAPPEEVFTLITIITVLIITITTILIIKLSVPKRKIWFKFTAPFVLFAIMVMQKSKSFIPTVAKSLD